MRRLAAAASLCAAMLAGCGDDEQEPARAVTVEAGAAVRVAGDEYSFEPSRVVVQGPGRLTITLDNQGALAHNLKVLDGEREIGGTPTFQGGKADSGTVTLERGRYRMVCTVGDHERLGMTGTLEVR